MNDIERLQHELHAKLPAFQRKVDKAKQIIEEALRLCQGWIISFSGGIDSTVMLHLISLCDGWREKTDVRWVDDGWDYRESITFLNDTEKLYGFRLHRMRSVHNWREWCVEMGRPDLGNDPQAYEHWGNPRNVWDGGWNSHEEWLQTLQPYGGSFIGMMASESRVRRLVLHNGNKPLYQVKAEHDLWHCSPLAAWTKQDVFAYLITRHVPYNPVYDKFAELGVPLERRRVAPLTCFAVMQYGSHQVLKNVDPELYNKLCAVFPKVRAYV